MHSFFCLWCSDISDQSHGWRCSTFTYRISWYQTAEGSREFNEKPNTSHRGLEVRCSSGCVLSWHICVVFNDDVRRWDPSWTKYWRLRKVSIIPTYSFSKCWPSLPIRQPISSVMVSWNLTCFKALEHQNLEYASNGVNFAGVSLPYI